MKLKHKIIVSMIICILTGMIPILYFIKTVVKEENYKEVHSQTTLLLDSKSKEVGSWLNQRMTTTTSKTIS